MGFPLTCHNKGRFLRLSARSNAITHIHVSIVDTTSEVESCFNVFGWNHDILKDTDYI